MSRDEVSIANPKQADDIRTFTYDAVFGQTATQKSIYTKSAFPLVESVLDGYEKMIRYNGTIFAYGQTGCGKTFTMMGVTSNETMKVTAVYPGHHPQNLFAHPLGRRRRERPKAVFDKSFIYRNLQRADPRLAELRPQREDGDERRPEERRVHQRPDHQDGQQHQADDPDHGDRQ